MFWSCKITVGLNIILFFMMGTSQASICSESQYLAAALQVLQRWRMGCTWSPTHKSSSLSSVTRMEYSCPRGAVAPLTMARCDGKRDWQPTKKRLKTLDSARRWAAKYLFYLFQNIPIYHSEQTKEIAQIKAVISVQIIYLLFLQDQSQIITLAIGHKTWF